MNKDPLEGRCDRQKNTRCPPRLTDVHIPIPETCEYMTLHCKRNFEGLIQDFVEKVILIAQWPQSHHQDPYEKDVKSQSQRCDYGGKGWKDESSPNFSFYSPKTNF